MVDKKESKKIETPFSDDFVKKLPLAFKYLHKEETDMIGEMYKFVKFSTSLQHRSVMVNNYSDFKPLSELFNKDDYYEK